MNEDYITYNQAVQLKQLGFDWKTTYYYDENGILTASFEEISADGGHEYTVSINNLAGNFNLQNGEDDEWCSAPTLAQAQKWLREKYYLSVEIYTHLDKDCNYVYTFLVRNFINPIEDDIDFDTPDYLTYEQALSAGVDKALELLKQENK